MANRIRPVDEKVKSMTIALEQINIEQAARAAGVAASTLRYDLDKVKDALPEVLRNRTPGPKPRKQLVENTRTRSPEVRPVTCPQCDGPVTKNGTYWVLNWLLMLTMGCWGYNES